MSTVFTLFMVLIIIACVLLVIIVMAQNPKGGGLSGTFGGSGAAQFGVQRTNDFMEKSTWTLAITIAALIILSVILTGKTTQSQRLQPTKITAPIQNTPTQSTLDTTNTPTAN